MGKILKKIEQSVFKGVVFFYCKIVYRVKVVGKENIPASGSLIFSGNHRTYLDPPLIVTTAGRNIRFLAKEELSKNFLMNFIVKLFDGIYLKRDEKDISAVKESLKTLKNGECIGIFPEGTRNGFKKNNGEIKNGASYLALKTGAKIVPIGIKGEVKPFHQVTITYGKPIDTSKYLTEGTKKISEEQEKKLSDNLKQEIMHLCE